MNLWFWFILAQADVAGSSGTLRSWEDSKVLAEKTIEKLSPWQRSKLLRGAGWHGWQLTPGFYVGTITGIKEAHIPWLKMQDSGNGFRSMLRQTVGTMIVWPSPLALASTWDEEAVFAQATAIGKEFRGKSANVMLGPGLNVHRISRGGRNFEYLPGEDPYLGARLARQFVKGVQGQGVMTVLKHFGFNEQETHRDSVNSVVDDRTAWELYYQPFEAAIDVGAGAVMCSYNKVNNTPACGNSNLLTRDLRRKMKFNGFVMSDWGASHSTAFAAGEDMDMPGFDQFYTFQAITAAKESDFNRSVQRVLASMYHLRLEEGDGGCVPPLCLHELAKDLRSEAHLKLTRQIASKAVIMLKNNKVLPLKAPKIRRVGVMGSAADAVYSNFWKAKNGLPKGDVYSGGGSGHVHGDNRYLTTVLEAIAERGRQEGVVVLSANTSYKHNNTRPLGMLKQEADVLIVVAGLETIESQDRPNLNLLPSDVALIHEASVAKPTIVLLMVPGAVLMPWRFEVSGILVLFYGGEATGHAFASVLFGDVNPAGKLPLLMPEQEEDTIPPATGSWAIYSEGMLTSYRNHSRKVAYPFGHGLSYTTFHIRLLRIFVDHHSWSTNAFGSSTEAPGSPGRIGPGKDSLVSLEVRVDNIGHVAGAQVVQAYAQFPQDRQAPFLQLRGFRRTSVLPPGGHEILYLHFNARDFSCYSQQDGWRVQDEVLLHLGSSSSDLEKPIALDPTVKTSAGPFATQVVPFTAHTTAAPETTKAVARVTTAAISHPVPAPGTKVPMQAVIESPKPTVARSDFYAAHSHRTPQGPAPPAGQNGPISKPRQAYEENNWILWALQPALLLLLLLAAVWCIRGESDLSDSEDDTKLPPELFHAAELPRWEYAYTGEGEMSPLVDAQGRVLPYPPL